MPKKIAVVLFNLGGPSGPNDVRKFLFNLFYDRRIIDLPNPFRWVLAALISTLRANKSKKIYAKIGNKSPIYENTLKQASSLEKLLNLEGKYRVFVAMRYWHPFAEEVIKKIEEFDPNEIILLPLYPHFSTTTVLSSIEEFKQAFSRSKMKKNVKISVVKEFYKRKSFVKNQVDLIRQVIEKYRISTKENILLFSAHGLPLSIIAKGDPYQRQIEENVEMIVKELNIIALQYKTCYQSRVGLKKWLSPTTEDEIRRAGSCGLGIIVVPISFVSEHSETMVELDIDYKKMAKTCKVPRFYRIPTQGNDQGFVKLLAELSLDKNRSN